MFGSNKKGPDRQVSNSASADVGVTPTTVFPTLHPSFLVRPDPSGFYTPQELEARANAGPDRQSRDLLQARRDARERANVAPAAPPTASASAALVALPASPRR